MLAREAAAGGAVQIGVGSFIVVSKLETGTEGPRTVAERTRDLFGWTDNVGGGMREETEEVPSVVIVAERAGMAGAGALGLHGQTCLIASMKLAASEACWKLI